MKNILGSMFTRVSEIGSCDPRALQSIFPVSSFRRSSRNANVHAGCRASITLTSRFGESRFARMLPLAWLTPRATGCLKMWRTTMTKAQLLRFIKIRNKSGFNTNLQFMVDMGECGIKAKELDNATNLNEHIGCWWDLPHGVLVELHGHLTLYASGTIVDMTTGKPFYSKSILSDGENEDEKEQRLEFNARYAEKLCGL